MIATVTLNAAIDKTYYMTGFGLGRVQRVDRMLASAGGKGINVARVASQLGESVLALGFAGGANGRFIASQLDATGIPHDFTEIPGESRICLNIVDEADRSQTELLEPGPEVGPADLARMTEAVRRAASAHRVVVFSGSLPKGCPPDTYATLVRAAREAGAFVALDTSGAPLAAAIEAQPDLVKPNEDEIEALTGRPAADVDDLAASIRSLQERGIANVVVTLGARGALAASGGRLYRVHPPRIEAVNAVGSGDAMAAGLAAGIARGLPFAETLRLGAACGAANALMPSAGQVRPDDVSRLLAQVEIEERDLP